MSLVRSGYGPIDLLGYRLSNLLEVPEGVVGRVAPGSNHIGKYAEKSP